MTKQKRFDGRRVNELRPVTITTDFVRTADGSCLIEMGGTRVICTASFAPGVPAWREGSGLGWVTAEYGMLPASTGRRKSRPIGKPDSRGTEIQRLIGRVMRTVVQLDRLGENTIHLDCDVLEADGGTRTASITGSYVALAMAVARAAEAGLCKKTAVGGPIAAVSVGVVDGRCMLDLNYREDSSAEVDMNVAMNNKGRFIELQGTGEAGTFSEDELADMIRLAKRGIRRLMKAQREALK